MAVLGPSPSTGCRAVISLCGLPHIASMGQLVPGRWMNPMAGTPCPVMEITPGPHSQECVTAALFWETALRMRDFSKHQIQDLC